VSLPAVTITPATVALGAGQTQQFQAATQSPADQPVVWSIAGAGSISTTGLYTAPPSISSNQTVTITAASPVSSAKTATATVTLTPAATALFIAADNTTRGSWKSVYGGDGFLIAGDSSSTPAYAQVSLTGQLSYTWSASTQDTRAVQKGAAQATDRVAAAWYNFAPFVVDVNVTGGPHSVALYALDWDLGQRAQRIDVLDASSGTLLDSRSLTGFSNGAYLVWNISGHVQFKVTRTSGPNAVVSGIFFGPGTTVISPPSITSSPSNVSVAAGQTATFTVAASGSNLTYAWQSQPPGGSSFSNIAGASSPSYTTPALTTADNGTQFRCVVQNAGGLVNSSAATLTVTSATVSSATFVSADSTTAGSWKGTYGADGWLLAGDTSSVPGYAQVSFGNQLSYVWSASTQDLRGLQKSSASDRTAAAWYGGSFTIDVNLSAGSHPVALYVVDWDLGKRTQRIDVLDAVSGQQLDTRTVSSFTGGTYLVWNVSGHVKFAVTRTAGPNAVVSGIFFGGVPSVTAPSITQNPANASVASGQSASFTVVASGSNLSYQWQSAPAGGSVFTNIVGAISSSYSTPTATASDNGTQFRCVVSNSAGSATTTAATLTVAAAGNAATFLSTDTSTKGSWKGVYGQDGFLLAGDATNPPSYAQVSLSGQWLYTWSTATQDVRALQKGAVSATDRVAAVWYNYSPFVIDVSVAAGSHRVALYLVDWDSGQRAERIDVLDASNGTVLDSRTASSFTGGAYFVWSVSGHVQFRVTWTGGSNAVVSGVFFGG
jgi:hypothetical protein